MQAHIFSKEVPELIESHFQHLHKGSGISIDVICERGYRSALDSKVLAEAGFSKSQQKIPGILIPLRGVDGEKTGYSYRPDHPRVNRKGKSLKYENPTGSSLRLDCPPRCKEKLGDPTVPLYITEGVKKGDALASRGVCTLVLPGVWGFKGKNRLGGVTLLADWDLAALNERLVYIVFDSDVMVKPEVLKALNRLTEHLRRKGARVSHAILPSSNGNKVGVDDYLLEHDVEDLINLATNALEEVASQHIEDIQNIFQDIEAGRVKPEKAVSKLRGLKGAPLYQRRSLISKMVVAVLKKCGTFIKNIEGRFYFHSPTKQLFDLDGFEFGAMLSDTFGLNQTESEFKFTLTDLNNEAHLRGQVTQIYRLAYYDRQTNTLYIDKFDGTVYRLNGENIEIVDNGTDGVMFTKLPSWEPYKYVKGSNIDGLLNATLIDDIPFQKDSFAPLTSGEQRMVFSLWIFSIFFESLLPTKPILAIIGEKGSGKTTTLRRVVRLLFGSKADVFGLERDKEDAFIANITHNYVAVFDNLDGRISWINDRLALTATSSLIGRRKLYTTNEAVYYQPRCFLALTSRNPQFKRDDVVDRLILLKVERLEHFCPESEILETIASQRDLLWTELLKDLNSIVARLGKENGKPRTDFRMSDWATLCWRIAELQGVGDPFDSILYKLSLEQANFAMEDDPLYLCLALWLQNQTNVGREINSKTLFDELSVIAEKEKIGWDYKSTISFAKRLNNVGSNLKQLLGLDIRKDNRGRKYYAFGLLDVKASDGVTG
jgi:hypothetical protein